MSADIHAQKILILDFGSQYTQLIARRVREVGVYSEIRSWDISIEEIREFAPSGIILSGGPESVAAEDSPRAPVEIFDMDLPLLGICYGMQTMAEQFGGKVSPSTTRAYSISPRSIMRLAMSMPLRKARQALATSKFWQFSPMPRLPATMDAVDGSR